MNKTNINLQIPKETYEDVKEIAGLGEQSAQAYMRMAIMSSVALDKLRIQRVEARLLARRESARSEV